MLILYQTSDSDEESESHKKEEEGITQFIAHVPVPSQKEVHYCH